MNKFIVLSSAALLTGGGILYSSFSSSTIETKKYQPRIQKIPNSRAWEGAKNFYNLIRRNPLTGEVSALDVLAARSEVSNLAYYKTNATFTWEEMGPDNIGGRTRAIIVDHTSDGSRIYAGGVSGGLFVSNDYAGTWQPVNDAAQTLIVSSMTQAPDGTIWFGTGSSFDYPSGTGGSGFIGSGLFKLSPGSNNIINIPSASPTSANQSSIEWSEINSVRVNANGRIYVAQNKGLRMSDDGGNTWINPVKAPNGTTPLQGLGQDIEITDDGVVLFSLAGKLYRSLNGDDATFVPMGANEGIAGSSQRMEIGISPADNNYMYITTVAAGDFQGLYKSTDKGATWAKIPALSSFNPFCCNNQGYYDLVCSADADDKNTVYIGGVDLYKYDGNFTQISSWNSGQIEGYFVHADQHSFAYNPKNKAEQYFGNDGGVFKTFNDGGDIRAYNRGYNVTQFYSVAMDADNKAMGGTQDNGTIQVTGKGYFPKEGDELTGGDGFDCDYSNITDVWFSSIYYGDAKKNGGTICGPGTWNPTCISSSDANFNTPLRLWESHNDQTSKDTIVYKVENGTREFPLVNGNGVKKLFTGTLPKDQPNGKFVPGSVKIIAGTLILTDDGNGNISNGGNGTINYNTGEYSVTFDVAPVDKLLLKAKYQLYFNSGDELILESNTPDVQLKGEDFRVKYTAPSYIGPGEFVKVKDPVQSLFAFGASTNIIYIQRGALKTTGGKWFAIPTPGMGQIKALEFSQDGNHLFVGSVGGRVTRISGLNNLYDSIEQVTVASIFQGPSVITGLGVDPKNPNNLLVTVGGYGVSNNVYLSTSALTATSTSGSFSSIQGNLPSMPVYDGVISNDPDKTLVIGTEYGVFTSTLADAGTWYDANTNLPRVPVFAVRQQINTWEVTQNEGVIYLGTHGRGIWKTSTLLSSKPIEGFSKDIFASDISIYPNPVASSNTIYAKILVGKNTTAKATIYDINGRLVSSKTLNLVQGDNRVSFANNLTEGNYFMLMEAEGKSKVAKFIVTR